LSESDESEESSATNDNEAIQDELDRQHVVEIDKYDRVEHQRIAWETQNQAWEIWGRHNRSDSELSEVHSSLFDSMEGIEIGSGVEVRGDSEVGNGKVGDNKVGASEVGASEVRVTRSGCNYGI
jgi:hypothetical protein